MTSEKNAENTVKKYDHWKTIEVILKFFSHWEDQILLNNLQQSQIKSTRLCQLISKNKGTKKNCIFRIVFFLIT
jgi:hypothetical protein